MDIKKTLDALRSIEEGAKFSFSGEKRGQKPGDQVRGTDKAKAKKSGAHPFAGKLVGAAESILADLDKQIIEGDTERKLKEAYDEYVLYINDKPISKYNNIRAARDQRDHVKSKFPNSNIELKQEFCDLVDIDETSNELPGLDSDSPIHGFAENDDDLFAPSTISKHTKAIIDDLKYISDKCIENPYEALSYLLGLDATEIESEEDDLIEQAQQAGYVFEKLAEVFQTGGIAAGMKALDKAHEDANDNGVLKELVVDTITSIGDEYDIDVNRYIKEDDDLFAPGPSQKFQQALRGFARDEQAKWDDIHPSWREDDNYHAAQDQIALILDLADICNNFHGFMRVLQKLAHIIESGRRNVWVYAFDEWLYDNGYQRLSDLWQIYDEQLNEEKEPVREFTELELAVMEGGHELITDTRIIEPDKFNVYYKPDLHARKAQLIARLVPQSKLDALIDTLSYKFDVHPEDFEFVPTSQDQIKMTEYGMTTGGTTQPTGMSTSTNTPPNPEDTQKIQQGVNKIKTVLPPDQQTALSSQTTKGLDALDHDAPSNTSQQGSIAKAFGPSIANIAQDPALLNKFNALIKAANQGK